MIIKLTELIKRLEGILIQHGDLDVVDGAEDRSPHIEVNGPPEDKYLLITDSIEE